MSTSSNELTLSYLLALTTAVHKCLNYAKLLHCDFSSLAKPLRCMHLTDLEKVIFLVMAVIKSSTVQEFSVTAITETVPKFNVHNQTN